LYKRAADLLELCGLSGGDLAQSIRISQAEVHRSKSEYLEARSIHEQILQDISVEQEAYNYALTVINIAQIDVEIGTSKQNIQQGIDKAISVFSAMGGQRSLLYCDLIQASLHSREGDFLTARALLQQSLKFAWYAEAEAVSQCLEGLSDFLHRKAVDQTTFTSTVTFLVHSLKLKRQLEIKKALQFLGEICLEQGDDSTATSLFIVALDGFTRMDVHRSRAECMLRMGDISKLHNNFSKAAEFWTAARPLFERASQAGQIVVVDERLASISHAT